MIPKVIYTYWHDKEQIPGLMRRCVEGWKRFNPDWRIAILDENSNIGEKPMNFQSLRKQHQADWVRLKVLKDKGGVWLDGTIIPIQPLEAWLDLHHQGFQGFFAPRKTNIIDNWVFGAEPKNPFLNAWFKCLDDAVQNGLDNYKKDFEVRYPNYREFKLPYFTMHACSYEILKSNPGLRKAMLLKPSTGKFGPLGISNIFHLFRSFSPKPFIKLNRKERPILNFLILFTPKGSILHKNFGYPPCPVPWWLIVIMLVVFIVFLGVFIRYIT
jgi:hypothetical protein